MIDARLGDVKPVIGEVVSAAGMLENPAVVRSDRIVQRVSTFGAKMLGSRGPVMDFIEALGRHRHTGPQAGALAA